MLLYFIASCFSRLLGFQNITNHPSAKIKYICGIILYVNTCTLSKTLSHDNCFVRFYLVDLEFSIALQVDAQQFWCLVIQVARPATSHLWLVNGGCSTHVHFLFLFFKLQIFGTGEKSQKRDIDIFL